jgi:hypothetical protein
MVALETKLSHLAATTLSVNFGQSKRLESIGLHPLQSIKANE